MIITTILCVVLLNNPSVVESVNVPIILLDISEYTNGYVIEVKEITKPTTIDKFTYALTNVDSMFSYSGELADYFGYNFEFNKRYSTTKNVISVFNLDKKNLQPLLTNNTIIFLSKNFFNEEASYIFSLKYTPSSDIVGEIYILFPNGNIQQHSFDFRYPHNNNFTELNNKNNTLNIYETEIASFNPIIIGNKFDISFTINNTSNNNYMNVTIEIHNSKSNISLFSSNGFNISAKSDSLINFSINTNNINEEFLINDEYKLHIIDKSNIMLLSGHFNLYFISNNRL